MGIHRISYLSNCRIGPHVAFDCSGLQITYTTAVKAIRGRGIVVNVALVEKPLTFDSFEFLAAEKKYVGSSCYTPEEYAEVIEAVASGISPSLWR
jgi:threonine dehydrogenase-like Zn-dependent dehydrogenase